MLARLSPITASDRKKDRKSTRLNSSHSQISYAVFCLKKKKKLCLRIAGSSKVGMFDQLESMICGGACSRSLEFSRHLRNRVSERRGVVLTSLARFTLN